jgi:hypothetical protein
MNDDGDRVYTADDVKGATWIGKGSASAAGKTGRYTVRLAECLIDGVTVRGSVTEYDGGRREVVYMVHGQTVGSLEEVAAILTGRWIAGDALEARDD